MTERIGGGWVFLILMCVLYVVVALFNPVLIENSLSYFARIIWNIISILILVFGIMLVSNAVMRTERTKRYLGEASGVKGWLIAMAGGVLSTGPIYMWYPLLSDLKEKGMKTSLMAAFLYNRAIKIPLMPMMIFYFGWPFTIILTIYMLLFSVVNGLLVGRLVNSSVSSKNRR